MDKKEIKKVINEATKFIKTIKKTKTIENVNKIKAMLYDIDSKKSIKEIDYSKQIKLFKKQHENTLIKSKEIKYELQQSNKDLKEKKNKICNYITKLEKSTQDDCGDSDTHILLITLKNIDETLEMMLNENLQLLNSMNVFDKNACEIFSNHLKELSNSYRKFHM